MPKLAADIAPNPAIVVIADDPSTATSTVTVADSVPWRTRAVSGRPTDDPSCSSSW